MMSHPITLEIEQQEREALAWQAYLEAEGNGDMQEAKRLREVYDQIRAATGREAHSR